MRRAPCYLSAPLQRSSRMAVHYNYSNFICTQQLRGCVRTARTHNHFYTIPGVRKIFSPTVPFVPYAVTTVHIAERSCDSHTFSKAHRFQSREHGTSIAISPSAGLTLKKRSTNHLEIHAAFSQLCVFAHVRRATKLSTHCDCLCLYVTPKRSVSYLRPRCDLDNHALISWFAAIPQ